MLTGDKMETAIDIGKSCRLITEEMTIHQINVKENQADHQAEKADILRQLQETCRVMKISLGESSELKNSQLKKSQVITEPEQSALQNKNALVITGEALIHGFEPEISQLIVKISQQCSSVLACRVSPKQKADIVRLIRQNQKDTATLAIGDGANDVNMITAAHVGIGIKGVEGQQVTAQPLREWERERYTCLGKLP